MTEIFILSLMVGAVAGLLAGLFGIGGGVIIVPALVWIFSSHLFNPELIMISAVATSLATIIPTSIASIITHHKMGALIWPTVFRLVPGIITGSLLAAILAENISASTLRLLFILYLLYVAITLALQKRPALSIHQPRPTLDYLAGFVIGGISALIGIGGGTLTVPYLLGRHLKMKNAVAISSACGLPIALTGTISYAFLGWNKTGLPEFSLGYVYLPAFLGIITISIITAPIGARLANKLPAQQLKRYFSILLFLIAAKMML